MDFDRSEIAPGARIGRYEIQQLVGGGGFATVYLAVDSELRRRVAIKASRHERLTHDDASPLMTEARILAELRHPSILNVLDVIQHNGQSCLVLEYAEAGTLRDALRDDADSLPRSKLVDIAAEVADALDYVHRRGYLHRNLKPNVILLDSDGRPKLSGFEVAIQTENLDSSAVMAGTPAYMAPEQLAAEPDELGPHTDIWGLGATIYESLTRQRPFTHLSSFSELREKIQKADLESPSKIDPTVPDELERICLKCLSKDPADRYSTAQLLASELREWRQGSRPDEQRRVFISHSTKDRAFVERHIVSQLEKNGIKTWYSSVDIQTASEWERSIVRGLESCDWFLVVMSPRSASSDWVKDELHWAIDNRPQRIVPVLIEDCALRDFHIRMARIQYADFRKPSKQARVQLMELFQAGGG